MQSAVVKQFQQRLREHGFGSSELVGRRGDLHERFEGEAELARREVGGEGVEEGFDVEGEGFCSEGAVLRGCERGEHGAVGGFEDW